MTELSLVTEQKTVLVIEDHVPLRKDLVQTLEREGYRVFAASNGQSGIRLALQQKPDLILCDIMLPNGNGYQVFSTIRQHRETSEIPFVFMTGTHSEVSLDNDHYLSKPFAQNTLLEVVKRRINEQHGGPARERNELEHIEALEHILRTISHELRHPICSSIGLASLLDMSNHKKNNRNEMHRIVQGIKVNAVRLDEITGILTDVVYQALENYRNKMTG